MTPFRVRISDEGPFIASGTLMALLRAKHTPMVVETDGEESIIKAIHVEIEQTGRLFVGDKITGGLYDPETGRCMSSERRRLLGPVQEGYEPKKREAQVFEYGYQTIGGKKPKGRAKKDPSASRNEGGKVCGASKHSAKLEDGVRLIRQKRPGTASSGGLRQHHRRPYGDWTSPMIANHVVDRAASTTIRGPVTPSAQAPAQPTLQHVRLSAGRALVVAGATLLPSIVMVGVPVWLIQPFAPQTADTVTWSWRLKALAPGVTLGLGFVALAAAVAALRKPSPSRLRDFVRATGVVVLLAGHGGAIWFARQNHFEWMFRPFPDATFVEAAAATDVEPDEPVIGVARSGDAVAFPVTRLGYHHLVNTTLGHVPIVGTY